VFKRDAVRQSRHFSALFCRSCPFGRTPSSSSALSTHPAGFESGEPYLKSDLVENPGFQPLKKGAREFFASAALEAGEVYLVAGVLCLVRGSLAI
jgi:hypothetical protein